MAKEFLPALSNTSALTTGHSGMEILSKKKFNLNPKHLYENTNEVFLN